MTTRDARGTVPEIHFVVGMSRAGTNWMMQSLNTHPELVALGETSFWGRNYVPPGQDGAYSGESRTRVVARAAHPPESVRAELPDSRAAARYAYLTPERYRREMAEALAHAPLTPKSVFDTIASVSCEVEGKSIFVEKTPHHVNFVSRIRAHYPRAKFIIMVRDPYDFMLSYKHQGDRKDERTKRILQSLYHPAACAFVASRYLRQIRTCAAALGDDALVVSFAEIEKHPTRTMSRVCAHLGIEDACQVLPAENSSFPQEPRPSLDQADFFWMNTFVDEDTVGEFGARRYEGPPNRRAIPLSAVRLFPWGLRTSCTLLRHVDNPIRYLASWFQRT